MDTETHMDTETYIRSVQLTNELVSEPGDRAV